MAYRERNDFGRGERDEEFRGNRGNDEWSRGESGRGYEESGRRNFGSEGYPQENFTRRSSSQGYRQDFGRNPGQPEFGQPYGQSLGYSEDRGFDREGRSGTFGEGYRRYGESYGRGPEGFDRESGSYTGYGSGRQTSGGPSYGSGRTPATGGSWQQGYGSEFGRGSQDFGGGSGFGDTRRFAENPTRGRFTGRGPKGYVRSDERIREDVSDRLEQHGEIDASEIEVRVSNGEVTLEGTVEDRRTKRMAEDLIETCAGVKQVHNRIRVQGNGSERQKSFEKGSPATGQSGSTGTSSRSTTKS